jgi:exopolyphosphatase/guanosine-5'-triphosphate,3'-diphosphate pyrophosphatase
MTDTAEAGADPTQTPSEAPLLSPVAADTLAAIDIGTNSFHLVVARVGGGNRFEVIAREKEMVRLGSNAGAGGDMKALAPEAIDRGVATLARMRQIAEIHDAPVHAVATSAVREAANAHVFLDRARTEAGVRVEVVTGTEEARLIHLGVLQAVPVYDQRLVLIDIGGGSTEILVGERGQVLASASLKLGALRLTRRFFPDGKATPKAVSACKRFVRSMLVPVVREVQRVGFDVAVGSSGSAAAVAALVRAERHPAAEEARTFNGFELTRRETKAVVRRVTEATTPEDRRRIPGMDERRIDIIVAGAIILDQTMRQLGVETLTISDYALREGVLLDALERQRGGAMHHLHDLRRRSVLHLADLMDEDPTHSTQVAHLALELFDGLRPVHRLGDDRRELLEAAALLCNVGLYVSHSGHHKHSYYVIRNSDHLLGFTDHEIELIAVIARYHRKSAPKPSHPEYAALAPEDQAVVRTLAGILRVAIALDRTHAGLVDTVVCAGPLGAGDPVTGDPVTVAVHARAGVDLSLELFSFDERKGLLEDVLARPVRVRAAASPPRQ